MTQSELDLQRLAYSIGKARHFTGANVSLEAEASLFPDESGEARQGDCLVSMLASGSKGNAAFFQCGDTRILIDAGISCRRIEQGLKAYGCKLSDLDGIFITHEHIDHVAGLPMVLKKSKVPVYTTEGTWQAIGDKVADYQDRFVCLTRRVPLKGIQVVPFSISHDAARPVGYMIFHGDMKLTLATDLGYVTPDVYAAAEHADILVLEANHDVEMLKAGPYPYYLQQRILGPEGHLSNVAAGELLANLPIYGRMNVILAHRSETNNTPAQALYTVRSTLAKAGKVVGRDVLLRLACQRGKVHVQERGKIDEA